MLQRRSNLPMSIQPQQQVPESSSYIGLSQHADSLPSTSGHHLPQRLQFQAAQQLLTQAAWSGEQLESQTGQLPHLAQQLQASISQQPSQQFPSLAQVMQMLLLRGSSILERAERRTIAEGLLSEGIACISSKVSDKIEVSLVSPAEQSLCDAC